jgi:hypothetical protein
MCAVTNVNEPRIGLYYPFIQFRSDAWLKLMALYWDRVARIVPRGYRPSDSDTVKRLQGEIGFVSDFHPETNDLFRVGISFMTLIERHGDQLAATYALDRLSDPSPAAHSSTKATEPNWWSGPFDPSVPPGEDSRLAYIYAPKISDQLQDALLHLGLGRPARDESIGMHPRLAFVYMQALASEMASVRKVHPLTDDNFSHAASGVTMDRIAAALLPGSLSQTWNEPDVEVDFAMVAIEMVVPKDIDRLPVQKIIELRKKHPEEMAAFQNFARTVASELKGAESITDQDALRLHLQTTYEKSLQPKVRHLEERLQSFGIDTVVSALNMKLQPPTLLVSGALLLGVVLNPVVVGGGALALGAITVSRKYLQNRDKLMEPTPEAFLYHLKKGMKAGMLAKTVAAVSRRFATSLGA